jgi:hypothetical protein
VSVNSSSLLSNPPKEEGGAAFESLSTDSEGFYPRGKKFLFLEFPKGCRGRHLYVPVRHRARGSLVI